MANEAKMEVEAVMADEAKMPDKDGGEMAAEPTLGSDELSRTFRNKTVKLQLSWCM